MSVSMTTYDKMKELLLTYNLIVDGSNGHWYKFRNTNSISILDLDGKLKLVDYRFGTIKYFESVEQLKSLLDFMCK